MMLTQRLALRPFEPHDAPALARYRSDPDQTRYETWSPPVSPQQAEIMVREFADTDDTVPGWSQHAVALRSTGVLIGDIGVGLHENLMQAEIGYRIAADHQRQGYGREAVSRMLNHLLIERVLHKVSAECDARNVASAALLHRVGFVDEGLRRSHTWIKDEWTDDRLFGLLAAEWRNRRAAG